MLRRTAALLALVSVAVWVGCDTKEDPVNPDVPEPSFDISDAPRGGNPHFYWLPPMVKRPRPEGVFDASVASVVAVEICEIPGEGAACLPNGEQPDGYPLRSGDGFFEDVLLMEDQKGQWYQTNWQTASLNGDLPKYFRVAVLLGEAEIGYADVYYGTRQQVKNPPSKTVIPLKEGTTLPVKFLIEEGAGEYAAFGDDGPCEDCAYDFVGPTGGTIVTPSGWATLVIPDGYLTKPTLVTLEGLTASPVPPTNPLPSHDPESGGPVPFLSTGPFATDLPQYGPYSRVTVPEDVEGEGSEDALLVSCQIQLEATPFDPPGPETSHHDLVIAQQVPGEGVELVETEPVFDVDPYCSGALAALQEASLRSKTLNWLGGLFGPTALHAAPMFFSHHGAAARLAGLGQCGPGDRPPPGTIGTGLCGGNFMVVDPVVSDAFGDLVFEATFDGSYDIETPLGPDIGRVFTNGYMPGAITVTTEQVGNLGGPSNKIAKFETPANHQIFGLTRFLGGFGMDLDEALTGFVFTTGEYSITWESVVGEGSTGGAVGIANSNGMLLAMLEYEQAPVTDGGGFGFSVLQSIDGLGQPSYQYPFIDPGQFFWQEGKRDNFEIRLGLDHAGPTVSLLINRKVAAGPLTLPQNVPAEVPKVYLGRLVAALQNTDEGLVWALDDLRVQQTEGSLLHSSMTISPADPGHVGDPYTTPDGVIPVGSQVAVVDVEARGADGEHVPNGTEVELVVRTLSGIVFLEGQAPWTIVQPPTTVSGLTRGYVISDVADDYTVDAVIGTGSYDDPWDYLTFQAQPSSLENEPTLNVTQTIVELDAPRVATDWTDPDPDETYTVELTLVDAAGDPLGGQEVEHRVHDFNPVLIPGTTQCDFDGAPIGGGAATVTDGTGAIRTVIATSTFSTDSYPLPNHCYSPSLPGFEWPWRPVSTPLRFGGPATITRYVVGTVTDAGTEDPIAGTDIRIQYLSGAGIPDPPAVDPEIVTTTVDGHYYWGFTWIGSGTPEFGDYLFEVKYPGPGWFAEIYDLPSDFRNVYDIAVPAPGSINGTVTNGGEPVNGMQVSYTLEGFPPSPAGTFTSPTGWYQLLGLQPGTYDLTFTIPGTYTGTVEDVVVTSGGVETVDFDLSPPPLPPSISGTVTVDGSPLGGYTVGLYSGGLVAATITNSSGQYSFSEVTPGGYWVMVSPDGAWWWEQGIELGPTDEATMDFYGMSLDPIPSPTLPSESWWTMTSWEIDPPSEDVYVCVAGSCGSSGPGPTVTINARAVVTSTMGAPPIPYPGGEEGVEFYYHRDDLGFYVRMGTATTLSISDGLGGTPRYFDYGFTIYGPYLPLRFVGENLDLVAVGLPSSGPGYNTPVNLFVNVREPPVQPREEPELDRIP
jgi:hypothetical protein